jgi:phenylacetate-CoA ligase
MTTENWNDTAAHFHPASAADYLPLPRLRELQLQRLQAIVALAHDRVPLFRQRMDARGLTPADIRTLADARKLPFTEKNDLRDTYPYGLFAVDMREVVRLHASSGTTGKPIVVGYTADDMQVWANVIARSLIMFGMRKGDILQNSFGYGLFTGGLGLHVGAEALGCTVVPVSGGNSDRQIMFLKDFGVTAMCCTPSYFIHLIEEAGKLGIDLKTLPLRTGIFGAEPWSEGMRKHIETHTNLRAYDIYGLTEIIGPGVGCECSHHAGLHIFEDHFYPEIIDPETLEPLPDGTEGELIFTTLSKRATPIIRYRTRDITTIIAEPCSCGRTLRRIKRINHRSDDMLIIRGVNVYPSQIEVALMTVEACSPNYFITLDRAKELDTVLVEVELKPECFSDSIAAMEDLRRQIRDAIARITGIRMDIRIVEPNSLARSQGKARRVLDKRKF